MVAQLLRLRLAHTGNLFRGNRRHGAVRILAVLIGLIALWALALGWRQLALTTSTADITVIAGSVLTLVCTVVPLLSAFNSTLDPRRYTLLGIPRAKLALGLYLASLISIPGLLIIAIALTGILAWPEKSLLASIAAVVGALTAVLAARVANAAMSVLQSHTHGRGIILLIIGVVIAGAVPLAIAGVFLAGSDVFAHGTAAILAWTPWGAAWALPAATTTTQLIAYAAIAAVTWGLLWWAWVTLVAIAVERPERDRFTSEDGFGWFSALPEHPAGAIAARSATYWARDPRYLSSILVIPIVPILMVIILNLVGVPWSVLALIPLPVMMLFLAWTPHNDLAHDSSALWLHISAGVRGRDDRLGRVLPILLGGIPLITILSVLSVGFAQEWSLLPALLGVSTALLLGGLGVSSYASARAPYSAVAPGNSPFDQPQTVGEGSAVRQGLSLAGTVLVAIPALVLSAVGMISGVELWFWAALIVGVVLGGVVLIAGIIRGGRILDRRGSELLEFVSGR